MKITQDQALEKTQQACGFVSNLMAPLAEGNPAVAMAYLVASEVLSPVEKQVVMLAASALAVSRVELYESIGLKTLTSFINHIAQTPVDATFSVQATRVARRTA